MERFDIELREARSGQTTKRTWSGTEIERSAGWLKRMNARGHDVFIRPAGEHGLVLVDGVEVEALGRMKQEGYVPAATAETNPGRFQAWVKLSEGPLPADVQRLAAQALGRAYGGDAGHIGQHLHYGRLAGFTNQDLQHSRDRDGRQPYVLAHDCPGKVAAVAPAFLERLEQALDQAAAREERHRRMEAIRTAELGDGMQHDPVHEYRRQAQRLIGRYGYETDLPKMDGMIAADMARGGRFTQDDIERGIREGSPNVESRKAGHMVEYAKQTAEKAWTAPEVQQQQREERERERQMQRGRDGPGMSL